MKKTLLAAASIVFAAVFAVSISAQTRTTPAGKIGVIDTRVFLDAKLGIKKYTDAIDIVNNEFKGAAAALDVTAQKLQNLQKEIITYREQAQKGVQFDQATANAKIEEYDKLVRDYNFRREDNEAKYNRRQMAVVLPVQSDISAALREYTRKNGYVVLLDISKFPRGMILSLDEKADVTRDFIAFYNARPATPAAK